MPAASLRTVELLQRMARDTRRTLACQVKMMVPATSITRLVVTTFHGGTVSAIQIGVIISSRMKMTVSAGRVVALVGVV